MSKRQTLGKGLGALIDDAKYDRKFDVNSSISEIEIDKIEVNPFQPRKTFDEELLNELAVSIKELGIIQPITLRKLKEDKFQLISGERRLRAARLAKLTTITAYVREADDQEMLEFALVENIQREDLNAIEIAITYQRLIDECKLTQEKLSERVGKKRSTITNYLRLLKLPAEIQLALRDRKISMGHARALINIKEAKEQVDVLKQVTDNDLSVRKAEEIARIAVEKQKQQEEEEKPQEEEKEIVDDYSELKHQLNNYFKTKVQFQRSTNGKGKIVIPFNSDNELQKIISILD